MNPKISLTILLPLLLTTACGGGKNWKDEGGNRTADYGKDAYGVPYAARDDGTLERTLDPDDIIDAVPRWEPITRAGNPPKYKVLGKSYTLLPRTEGYEQKGTASWYGRKFHGRKTANGEIYDMYGMSAAHKTLPIPSYVEVTNLSNGRSAIVRVNDRGPFAHDRIIDLSYAAAIKLGVFKTGTAKVRVKSITVAKGQNYRPNQATAVPVKTPPRLPPPPAVLPTYTGAQLYVQVASFADRAKAENQWNKLLDLRLPAELNVSEILGEDFYQVRIGPYSTLEEADEVVARMAEHGYPDTYLVTE